MAIWLIIFPISIYYEILKADTATSYNLSSQLILNKHIIINVFIKYIVNTSLKLFCLLLLYNGTIIYYLKSINLKL